MNCPKCFAVLQLADKSRPACTCGWNMDEELEREDYFANLKLKDIAALVKAARELVEGADQASAFVAHVHNDRVDALIAALKPFEGS